MRKWNALGNCFFVLVGACAANAPGPTASSYRVIPLSSGSTSSLRGVSVVDARTVWASGTQGTVLRSLDGGLTWTVSHPPQSDSLDFRDIAALDANNAFVLSAGEDGRIYRTRDGGSSWTLLFRNTTKGAFFDCIDFWDARHGIAMSDPIKERFIILRTDDGDNWRQLPRSQSPTAGENEAAFAASGTCLITRGVRTAFLASGGGAKTHVYVTQDRGNSWTTIETPIAAGSSAAGVFSLAFKDENTGVALGGNYERPAQPGGVALTTDGGKTWTSVGSTEYVSGGAWIPNTNSIVATGTNGTRISNDRGASWVALDTVEYNAVQFSRDGTGYAVGPRGRIAKIAR